MGTQTKYSTAPLKRQRHIPWFLILIFILLSAVIIYIGKNAYDDISSSKIEDLKRELQMHSDLKVIQIMYWNQDKRGDANLILTNPILYNAMVEYLSSSESTEQKSRIRQWFITKKMHQGFRDIFLVDSTNRFKITTREDNSYPLHAYKEIAESPKEYKTPYLFDVHRGEPDSLLEQDIFIPIHKADDKDTIYLGSVILQIDVRELMKPLLETSFATSKTYETVFFRRYGDSVQILNDLRFKPKSALNLFIPLSDTNFPAVQTVFGKRGIMYGLDYRQVKVIAFATEIPNTNWFIITKIDEDEVLNSLNIYFIRIILLIVSIILLAGVILFLIWRKQDIKHYKQYYNSQKSIYEITKRYENLTKYANDAILIFDESFRVIDVNDKAIELYGYKLAEFLYLTPKDLRSVSSLKSIEPDYKILEETSSLLVEAEHKKKNGESFPVEISMKRIQLKDSKYYIAIIRDITERKKSENELSLAEKKYRLLTENITDIIIRTDTSGKIIFANTSATSFFKNKPIESKHLSELIFEKEDIEILIGLINTILKNPNIVSHAFDFVLDGERCIIDCICIPEFDENNIVSSLLLTMRNITHTKILEDSLIQSEKLYRDTFEEASVGIAHVSLDSRFLKNNKKFSEITGYYEEELVKLKYNDITNPDDYKTDLVYSTKLTKGEIEHYSMEQRYIRKDKSTIWVNLTVSLIRNPDNTPDYYIIVVEDISKRKKAEATIVENEKKFRTLIEHSTVLFYSHTTKHLITYVSPQITNFFDSTPEEAMINWTKFATDNPVNEIGYYLTQKAIDTGITQPPYELELKGMKGRIVWVEVHESPVVVYGKTVAIVGSLTDITYRKKAEQEIIESKDLLEKITSTSPTIITIFDTVTEKNVFKNRSLLDTLGYSKEDISKLTSEGLGTSSLLHPDDEEILNESYEKISHMKEGEIYDFEYRLKNVKGEWQWIRRLTNVFKRDEDGKPLQVLNIFENVTQRKNAEIEVGKLSTAITQSPVCVIITDILGSIEYVNPRFTKVTGYNLEEVIGKNPRILKSGFNPQQMYTDLWYYISNGKVWSGELCNRKKNGELYWVSETISPLKNEKGEVTNYISVSEDITEKKHRDEQIISSLKEKETLLREIHHRVKNNFQVISSLLKMQSDYIKDKDTKEHLKITRDRVKSMSLIHEQLYQAENLNYIDFRTYLQKLVTHSYQVYRTGKHIEFNIDAKDILLNIDTAIPLGLITNELVSNSFKYAFEGLENGSISITVSKMKDENIYKLVYKDSGIGLPDGIDFEKTTSLGMQLVTSLTEQLDGSMEVIKGNGVHFEITFKQLTYKPRF